MLSRKSLRGAVLVALCLAASAGVSAAEPGGSGAVAEAPAVARQASLSPQEQVAEGASILARMQASRGVVRRQLESARVERDVVKVLCLNDKLSQIDVAIRSAQDRKGTLDSAASRGDVDLANHSFTLLTIFRQRVEAVTAEANACVGTEPPDDVDSSSVRVLEEDPMKEDPSAYPSSELIIEVPSCSSCFK